MTAPPNTHGARLEFGKWEGSLITRVPVGYLRFMVNHQTKQWELASAEMIRRHSTMPTVELSPHAIDNASLRVRKRWHETRGKEEGLFAWLQRVTLEAIDQGEEIEEGIYIHLGMKFVVEHGHVYPILKTIMESKHSEPRAPDSAP